MCLGFVAELISCFASGQTVIVLYVLCFNFNSGLSTKTCTTRDVSAMLEGML